MIFKATLSNTAHPEYGQATIPFPAYLYEPPQMVIEVNSGQDGSLTGYLYLPGPGVSITFPATVEQVREKTAEFRDRDTLFIRGEGIVWHFAESIKTADLFSETGIQRLNQLSEAVDAMDHASQQVFAGALRAESINGVDDILRIASSLEQYEFIDGVTSDKALGGWVVEHGLAGVNFPKDTWPYLDYAGLGAKYYSDHGGAYTANGYVKQREPLPELETDGPQTIRLTLTTSRGDYPLGPPKDRS